MKRSLFILFYLPLMTLGQQTYVPDDAFEACLEANGMGNGIPNDDYVTTANINTVTSLWVHSQNISDLTGIEDFFDLRILKCYDNQLTTLDVSQNTALTELWTNLNQLTSIDVSGATNLSYLDCGYNQLTTLDVSQNTSLDNLICAENQLTSLDLSNNLQLDELWCQYNQITSLDLSNNVDLFGLFCIDNELTELNVKNGNNTNFWSFNAYQNPNLYCITVDDSTWSANNWWNIDLWASFNTNCPPPSTIQEYITNKALLTIKDVLGREPTQTNQPLFYIYDDGTVEKRITIE